MEALTGRDGFASARLKTYHTDRNNPNKPKVRPPCAAHTPLNVTACTPGSVWICATFPACNPWKAGLYMSRVITSPCALH